MITGVHRAIGLLAFGIGAFCLSAGAEQTAREPQQPKFKKVFIVILENADYSKALSQPFMRDLSRRGVNLTNMYAQVHPSQPNYIALTAGSLHGVDHDHAILLDVKNIVDLLEAKGKTWKVYAERFRGNCYTGRDYHRYAIRHVPFLNFANIRNDQRRCSQIVEASALDSDLANGRIADYSFYVPDNVHNGHDTNVRDADKFLARRFGPLLQDARFMSDMLVIVTFDESRTSRANNHIYTTLLGNNLRHGHEISTRLNHYSLLRLIEDSWGLGSLGLNDQEAAKIEGIFN